MCKGRCLETSTKEWGMTAHEVAGETVGPVISEREPVTAKGRILLWSAERWPLMAQLREDMEVNQGWQMPGFQAIAVARVGAWAADSSDSGSGAAPRLFRRVAALAAKRGYALVRNVYGIELPHTVHVGRRVKIAHQGGIVIHPQAEIGDDCVLRQNVTLGAGRGEGELFQRQAPKLGRGVSVGANVVIVGSVRVGDDAVVGPNATVMTHIPAGATVLAPPPRVIRPKTNEERLDK